MKSRIAMLTSIQSAGVAPEVNLRNSVQARKHASEKSTLALKPRADVTRSPKQGISSPTKRIYVLQIFFFKKSHILNVFGQFLVFSLSEKMSI